MKFLKVNLWGHEIGRLVWNPSTRRIYFMFNPDRKNEIPDIAPLISPMKNRNMLLPIYGYKDSFYEGLPPFIADSLPDSWGNTLFEKWVSDNRIPKNQVTPLFKLMFIGTRGMGALEYEPCAEDLTHTHVLDIKSLYSMSLKILEDRENIEMNSDDELTLQALLSVGTSAGGRQLKAIIAINEETGEIRSGQTDGLDGYDYFIVKFGDKSIPLAEIETAYYKMAIASGIRMEESRILSVDGYNHFLTKRFDRKNGKKIHTQTLAAMNPEADSYESLIATCRELSIPEAEIERLYAVMVFNVMANNTDDHNKNFSFLLEENDRWQIAPAYDMTFIFNVKGTGPNIGHRLSIGGKIADISKKDLLDFALLNDIKNANSIIKRVAEAIENFNDYADESGITQPWRSIIQKTLTDNLIAYGFYEVELDCANSFTDVFGRLVSDMTVSVNSKGYFEVSVIMDGKRQRRFIRPNMDLYLEMKQKDIYHLSAEDKSRLVEALFPNVQ